ncbi:hypothetical protein ACFYWX_09150 [Streptomyces sp. NPDC002888]|uniref:hypothetical protein n=1 Tax=Streptomyces sp. NPDC002888 TaxID=3364668 RepID=UPI0036B78B85
MEQAVTVKDSGASTGSRLLCLVLLLGCFWALRRALLARLAYAPGPVDVERLNDATPAGTSKPPVDDLTARLRKHLSETDLYPPATLPAEPPAENFIDLLGDVNLESGKFGTSLLHMFSRLRPKVAYQVTGVLQRAAGGQKACCGVTVTVTAYTTRGSCAHTVWETTWDKAVHETGNWVMAAILPVTRAAKSPPWQAWRKRTLPPELFAAYQRGRDLSRQRKFDEALCQFYKAVFWDPTNLYLRTQIAGVQEKMGLHLDALETYHGALTMGTLTAKEDFRTLWAAPWALRRFTYVWHWRHRPGILLARYRYAVVLGTAERLAHQWCHAFDADIRPSRASAREEIREALTPALAERYWPAVADFLPQSRAGNPRQWIEETLSPKIDNERLRDKEREENYPWVRLIFQLASLQEFGRLTQDRTAAIFCPKMRADRIFTAAALRITRDVWAPLRLAWAAAHPVVSSSRRTSIPAPAGGAVLIMPKFERARDGFRPYLARVIRPVNTMGWAPSDLQRHVRRARTPLFRERRRDWMAHYNAACVYAIALNVLIASTDERDQLARLAYRELRDAVTNAESGFVTLTRSWVVAEDADLAPLRKDDQHDRLARFEREAYPHDNPDRHRFDDPPPIHIEMAFGNMQLLSEIAGAMEQTWHRRNSLTFADVHDAIRWFESELSIWCDFLSVSKSQARNWPDREKLFRDIQQNVDPELLMELPCRVPEINHILEEHDGWRDSQGAKDNLEKLDKELTALSELVKSKPTADPPSPIDRSANWLTDAKLADSAGHMLMHGAALRQVCEGYAAVWQTLRDALPLSDVGSDHSDAKFRGALRRLPEPTSDTWTAA